MPNRVFRYVPLLGTQRPLELNTIKVGRSNKRVTSNIRTNRGSGDAVAFKVSKELGTNIRILNVTIENLRAAHSTIRETDLAKAIAIMTRDHILRLHQSP